MISCANPKRRWVLLYHIIFAISIYIGCPTDNIQPFVIEEIKQVALVGHIYW